jgi:hypothetical protein
VGSDPLVVSRNLTSVTWEQGLYVSEVALAAEVSCSAAARTATAESVEAQRRRRARTRDAGCRWGSRRQAAVLNADPTGRHSLFMRAELGYPSPGREI